MLQVVYLFPWEPPDWVISYSLIYFPAWQKSTLNIHSCKSLSTLIVSIGLESDWPICWFSLNYFWIYTCICAHVTITLIKIRIFPTFQKTPYALLIFRIGKTFYFSNSVFKTKANKKTHEAEKLGRGVAVLYASGKGLCVALNGHSAVDALWGCAQCKAGMEHTKLQWGCGAPGILVHQWWLINRYNHIGQLFGSIYICIPDDPQLHSCIHMQQKCKHTFTKDIY